MDMMTHKLYYQLPVLIIIAKYLIFEKVYHKLFQKECPLPYMNPIWFIVAVSIVLILLVISLIGILIYLFWPDSTPPSNPPPPKYSPDPPPPPPSSDPPSKDSSTPPPAPTGPPVKIESSTSISSSACPYVMMDNESYNNCVNVLYDANRKIVTGRCRNSNIASISNDTQLSMDNCSDCNITATQGYLNCAVNYEECPDIFYYPKLNFPDYYNIYATYKTERPEDCGNYCSRVIGCRAATFDNEEKLCHLRSTIEDGNNVTGFKLPKNGNTSKCPDFFLVSGRPHYVGQYDHYKQFSSDRKTCENNCIEDEGCDLFTYDNSQKKCTFNNTSYNNRYTTMYPIIIRRSSIPDDDDIDDNDDNSDN